MAVCNYGKIYTDDKGTEVILDCGEDISTGLIFKIIWRDPTGLTGEWVGTVYNTNYIRYINLSEWGVEGIWRFQAYVEFPTGFHFYGRTYEEQIFPLYG